VKTVFNKLKRMKRLVKD